MKALYKMRESQNGYRLMSYEALCHLELCKLIIKLHALPQTTPKYGREDGLSTFISCGWWLDASVFLYESFKHLSLSSSAYEKSIKSLPFFSDLEVVRNNIHTYFKSGNYGKKSSYITAKKLKDYKLDEPDWLYSLRNDISLVFQIHTHSRLLVGCDYFISHCIFESDEEKWDGPYFQAYSEFLSSHICKLAQNVSLNYFNLEELTLRENLPCVELFDYKSQVLGEKAETSWPVTFRLLLILYQISNILLLLEDVVELDSIAHDSMWLLFFGKLLAIKYDESFDNLQSLLKYSVESDRNILLQHLQAVSLDMNTLVSRKFAQNLRNTIHYQELTIDLSVVKKNLLSSQILATFFSNTGIRSMAEFRTFFSSMMNEVKLLQNVIRNILNLDTTYSS